MSDSPQLLKKNSMKNELLLRDVLPDDLPIFFEQQLNQEANTMAAFTAKDPTDQEAFMVHWRKNLGNDTCIIKTILFNGQVAGSVSSYEEEGKPEVTYWLGKEYWGKHCYLGASGVLSAEEPNSPDLRTSSQRQSRFASGFREMRL